MSTITFRATEEVDRALAELAAESDHDRSAAIRQAILQTWQQHRAERVRAEAQAVAADPADQAEMAAVREEMDQLRAW